MIISSRARYVNFSVDLGGALELAQKLSSIPSRILMAQQRALGTLRRRILPEAKRDIAAEYNLKLGRIAQGLKLSYASDGIVLRGWARGINAIEFGGRWKRSWPGGARYVLKRGYEKQLASGGSHDGSFIAVGLSNNRLIFERGGKLNLNRAKGNKVIYEQAHYKPNIGRLKQPLQAVYGPSISQMLKHGRRPERLAEFAIRILEAEQARILKAGI